MAKIWDKLEFNEELPLTELLEHVSILKQKWDIQDEDITVCMDTYYEDNPYIYLGFEREETNEEIKAKEDRILREKVRTVRIFVFLLLY